MQINVQELEREALKQLMTHAELFALQSMRTIGQVPATLFIQTVEGPIALRPRSLGSTEAKDDFAATARLMCIAHKASATVLVAESWFRTAKKGQSLDLSVAPSEAPDRQEIVAIMGETRYGAAQKMLPIMRTAGRFEGFGEALAVESGRGDYKTQGRFSSFLPEQYPDQHSQDRAREILKAKMFGQVREQGHGRGL